MPGWKRDVGRRLDELISSLVPEVRKAVRWNSPMYGIEGQGWFASFHVFTNYVKLTFFKGTSLKPIPHGGSVKEARWNEIREGKLEEEQMSEWIRQAASIPGWGKSCTVSVAGRRDRWDKWWPQSDGLPAFCGSTYLFAR